MTVPSRFGLEPAHLSRSGDRWEGMAPAVVAAGSAAQIQFALVDARHDILELVDENRRLRAHIEALTPGPAPRWTQHQLTVALAAVSATADNEVRRRRIDETLAQSGWQRP